MDRNKGWLPEIDIITWILVGAYRYQNGRMKLDHIYWFPHHIWVNNSLALINGRELYGYNKYLCEYVIPPRGSDVDRLACSVEGFQPFGPDTELAMHPLMEVHRTQEGKDQPLADWTEAAQGFERFIQDRGDFFEGAIDSAELALRELVKPGIDQVFLKQFPDSTGTRAVYQGVIAANAAIKRLRGFRFLGHSYRLDLHPLDSFPLAETLGWSLGEQPALLPFNVYFDFEVEQGTELLDNSRVRPEKLAIIGGGVAAMTAAFYLTDQPGWQNRYDITVYQQGWRLGGKGASGRNADHGQRIEEHGLHIWFGFYDNAFRTIKKAYELLDRPPDAPLATWDQAFKPHSLILLAEHIQDHWEQWPLLFPENHLEPGTGREQLSIWSLIRSALGWISKWLGDVRQLAGSDPAIAAPGVALSGNWLAHFAALLEKDAQHLKDTAAGSLAGFAAHLERWLAHPSVGGATIDEAGLAVARGLLAALKRWLDHQFDQALEDHAALRRLYISLDLGVTICLGCIEDGVPSKGFDAINNADYREWLARHGANQRWTVDSAPVRGFYDLVFAYEKGDFNRPNLEAGTIIRAMARIAFLYRGAIMYKMQAGMGDTLFTPFYEVLKRRGVKFEFFHQVRELVPDGDTIGQIRVVQQVQLADPAGEYDPLVEVKGLACWPSRPRYDQIEAEQARLLQARDINLESWWSDWPSVYRDHFGQDLPEKVLERGTDFDRVIFGASIDSLAELGPRLLEQDPGLKTCCGRVQTVATQAFQVWGSDTLEELGWPPFDPARTGGQEPVLSGFSEPFDTWASMDQLLVREDWPQGAVPRNLAYFCSALSVPHYPPASDHGFPDRCKKAVKQGAVDYLENRVFSLWPDVAGPGQFSWQILMDPEQRQGPARFDAQFWRANIDPSERYVLSVTNSSQYRLATDGTRFTNLWITGDWIRTGLNAGCVEAATMAGMQTARAISGYPETIYGETDGPLLGT